MGGWWLPAGDLLQDAKELLPCSDLQDQLPTVLLRQKVRAPAVNIEGVQSIRIQSTFIQIEVVQTLLVNKSGKKISDTIN